MNKNRKETCLYKDSYHWTTQDKWNYALSLIPFVAAFLGSIYLLGTISITLSLVFIILYLIGNIFQAGACTGCPYRGRYCPPVFGVYLGNMLSGILYRHMDFDLKFIETHAKIAEVVIYGAFLFPVYWLFSIEWYYILVYMMLLALHLILFMPNQCEMCSYNEICPGGIIWRKISRKERSKE